MTAHLIRGDARRLPLASGSVQCVVTSPPYMGLRSYGGQVSIWGGDPDCPHSLEDGPALKPMTGGTGAASKKQVTNAGSQFGNAWSEERYYVEGGGTAGSSKEAFSKPGPENAARIKAARWRTTATCTRCCAWRGELGSEPNVGMFIEHLVEVFRECKRVLRDDGICFINIGDGYSGSGKGPTGHNGIGDQSERQGFTGGRGKTTSLKWGADPSYANAQQRTGSAIGTLPKSLQLVPERLALALAGFSTVPGSALVQMADELAAARTASDWLMVSAVESQLRVWAAMSAVFDGWIVRSRIAWCKAAPMPESVRDRPTSAWEHIFMLTKGPRYYYDADAVREPHAEKSFTVHTTPRKGEGTESAGEKFNKWLEDTGKGRVLNPAGANQRNWWLLGPDPYSGAHFATYPRELVRRCVAAATSEYGACAACGAPWRRDNGYNKRDGNVHLQRVSPATSEGSVRERQPEEGWSATDLSGVRSGQAASEFGPESGLCARTSEELSRDTSRGNGSTQTRLPGVGARSSINADTQPGIPTDRAGQGKSSRAIKTLEQNGARADNWSSPKQSSPRASDECTRDIHTGRLDQNTRAAEAALLLLPEAIQSDVTPDNGSCRPVDEGRGPQPGEHRSGVPPLQFQEVEPPSPTGLGPWQPTCKCGPSAGVRPCIVLDLFAGSGTTCFVAAQLGRTGIGVELSAEYIQQARYGRLKMDFLPLGPAPAPVATTPTEPPPSDLFSLLDEATADGAEAVS